MEVHEKYGGVHVDLPAEIELTDICGDKVAKVEVDVAEYEEKHANVTP